MLAVIRTGGKQYRVAGGDVLTVEKLAGNVGDTVPLGEVLALIDGADIELDAVKLAGATVGGEILRQGRGEKVIVFKKNRRQNYRRKNGHRQSLTTVRVGDIAPVGGVATKKAAATKKAGGAEKKPTAKKAPEKSKEGE